MKFTVTFKTKYDCYNAINEIDINSMEKIFLLGLTQFWVMNNEFNLEFDSENKTCIALSNKQNPNKKFYLFLSQNKMKFKVAFKTPNGCHTTIHDMDIPHEMKEHLYEFTKGWVKNDEYVYLEFDSENGTCIVLPYVRSK